MKSLRIAVLSVMVLGLTACSGGGGGGVLGGLLGGNPSCDPGTKVDLARPQQDQLVNGNIGSIEVVSDGSNNTFSQNYQSWNLLLDDSFDPTITAGPLNPVSDTGGPHPFQMDFYYAGAIPQLPSGRTWTVRLQQSYSSCTPYVVGQFNT